VAILAGTSELQLWEFVLFAYSGALLWTTTFMSIGYYFGDKWEVILHDVSHHTVLVSALILALVIIFYYVRAKVKNRSGEKSS
jgi:membrane protein DedA with SNARE-associated domain